MLVFFPHLHPELASGALPDGTLFLDPGATEELLPQRFRPQGLPLAPPAAKRLLADCLRFGEQFRHPGEMASLGLAEAQAGASESSLSIRAQLLARIRAEAGGGKPETPDAAAAQAQFVLLLAWLFEERTLEMQDLEQGLEVTWRRFGEALGLGEDQPEDQALGQAVAEAGQGMRQEVQVPWPRILEAMAPFLPEEAVLVVADYEIGAALTDAGIVFEPSPEGSGLPGSTRLAKAPLWQAMGLARDRGRPLDCRLVRMALI